MLYLPLLWLRRQLSELVNYLRRSSKQRCTTQRCKRRSIDRVARVECRSPKTRFYPLPSPSLTTHESILLVILPQAWQQNSIPLTDNHAAYSAASVSRRSVTISETMQFDRFLSLSPSLSSPFHSLRTRGNEGEGLAPQSEP